MANELKPFGPVTSAWNTSPAAPVDGLESYEYGFPSMTKVSRGGDWCLRSQAEAIIAAERAKVQHWQEQYTEMHSQFIDLAKSAEADNAALTARVKELTTVLDQQLGTPCEQIAHSEEVKALETQLAAALGGKSNG